MKRSIFFIIVAILALLFGGMMFFTPSKAAEGFGIASTPDTIILFRSMGALILSTGIMNFLVRNHGDNITLRAVLITNVVTHGLSMVADLWAVADRALMFNKAFPGQVVHLFVAVGSIIYLMRMKTS